MRARRRRHSDACRLSDRVADRRRLRNDLGEEESRADQDHDLSADTIALLTAKGGTVEFIVLLRSAIGASEGVGVEWTKG